MKTKKTREALPENRAILETRRRGLRGDWTVGPQIEKEKGRKGEKVIGKIAVMLLCSFAPLLLFNLSGATVNGYLRDINQSLLNDPLIFTPTNRVTVTGTNLFAGPAKIVYPTNGFFTTVLETGDYTVLIRPRISFMISVPNSTNSFTLISLINSGTLTYNYTNPLALLVFKAGDVMTGPLTNNFGFFGDGSGLTNINASTTNAVSTIKTNGANVATAVTSLNFSNGANTTISATVNGAAVAITIGSTGGGGSGTVSNQNILTANLPLEGNGDGQIKSVSLAAFHTDLGTTNIILERQTKWQSTANKFGPLIGFDTFYSAWTNSWTNYASRLLGGGTNVYCGPSDLSCMVMLTNMINDGLVARAKAYGRDFYLSVNDGWQCLPGGRVGGRITVNSNLFPNGMPDFVDRVHALGVKVRLYNDITPRSCCGLEPFTNILVDAQTMVDWKIDALTIDTCNSPSGSDEYKRDLHEAFIAVLKSKGWKGSYEVHFNPGPNTENYTNFNVSWPMQQNTFQHTREWGGTHPTNFFWDALYHIDIMENVIGYLRPGHYPSMGYLDAVDPDGYYAGNYYCTPYHMGYLTLTMWAMFQSDLIFSADYLSDYRAATHSKFQTNEFIYRIQQDTLCAPPVKFVTNGSCVGYYKPLDDGSVAFAFINRTNTASGTLAFSLNGFGAISNEVTYMFDFWNRTNRIVTNSTTISCGTNTCQGFIWYPRKDFIIPNGDLIVKGTNSSQQGGIRFYDASAGGGSVNIRADTTGVSFWDANYGTRNNATAANLIGTTQILISDGTVRLFTNGIYVLTGGRARDVTNQFSVDTPAGQNSLRVSTDGITRGTFSGDGSGLTGISAGSTNSPVIFTNTPIAYVHTNGNDSTAIIGRSDKPFATAVNAFRNCPSGGVVWFSPGATYGISTTNFPTLTNNISVIAWGATLQSQTPDSSTGPGTIIQLANNSVNWYGGILDSAFWNTNISSATAPVKFSAGISNSYAFHGTTIYGTRDVFHAGSVGDGFRMLMDNGWKVFSMWDAFKFNSTANNSNCIVTLRDGTVYAQSLNGQTFGTGPSPLGVNGGRWFMENVAIELGDTTDGIPGSCYSLGDAVVDLINCKIHYFGTNGSTATNFWTAAGTSIVNIFGFLTDPTNVLASGGVFNWFSYQNSPALVQSIPTNNLPWLSNYFVIQQGAGGAGSLYSIGADNIALSSYDAVLSGFANYAGVGAYTLVAGGAYNTNTVNQGVIGGGLSNNIGNGAASTKQSSTIAGGRENSIVISGSGAIGYATISGGVSNFIGGSVLGRYATIPGGRNNSVTADEATAIGNGVTNSALGSIALGYYGKLITISSNGVLSGNGGGLTNLSGGSGGGTVSNATALTTGQVVIGADGAGGVMTTNSINVDTNNVGTLVVTNRTASFNNLAPLAGTLTNAIIMWDGSNWVTNSGAGISNLASANLTGTIADARLSSNVPLLSAVNTFSNNNEFQTGVQFDSSVTFQSLAGFATTVNIGSTGSVSPTNIFEIHAAGGLVNVGTNGVLNGNASGLTNLPATGLNTNGSTATGQFIGNLGNGVVGWTNAAAGGGAATADIQIYTNAGTATWTNPANSKWVTVICIGGGGGGGSGAKRNSATVSCGGGGGAGGAYSRAFFPASILGSTVTVTNGGGGAAGVGQITDDLNGSAGTAGTNTFFGKYLRAGGGGAGAAGTSTSGTGGTASTGEIVGTAGASASTSGGSGGNAGSPSYSAAGGGAGGGVATTPAATSGGNGGSPGTATRGALLTGGAGGSSGAAGGTGTNPDTNEPQGGPGGGGGASTIAAATAGAGGAGGNYGGGGGGGGAALGVTSTGSGAGGAGGNGFTIVITTF